MAFGEPFGCLKDGVFHSWVSLITETIKAGAYEQTTRRMFMAGSLMQRFLCKFIPTELRRKRVQHLELSKEKCLKYVFSSPATPPPLLPLSPVVWGCRRERKKGARMLTIVYPHSRRIDEGLRREHRDFLYYILRQNEKGGVSQDEIILNSALFIVAGSETTASLLSGLLMWLLRSPDAYRKLTDEIRSNFATAADMHFTKLQDLPYMNACIDEALRIFPPIPTGLTRTVPKDGDTVAGEFLPGGVTVSCHGWACSHSPLNFTQPDSFIPERWLDRSGAHAKDISDASQPFSLGPRGCIGRHLTYLELRLILANLLWHYDLERADLDDPNAFDIWDPSSDLHHVKAFNTWNKPPLMCRLKIVKR